jgi:hypothetical protein
MPTCRWSWIAVAAALAGCAHSEGGTVEKSNKPSRVQERASFDLGCPVDQLTELKIDNNAWGVRGCGKQAVYQVVGWGQITLASNVVSLSPEAAAAAPMEIPQGVSKVKQRASFDLACPAAQLVDMKMSDNTWGVRGCGRQATYKIIGWGQVLMDSPAIESPPVAEAPAAVAAPDKRPSRVQERASFDLNCPVGALEETEMSDHTWGVRGCGRQATYKVVGMGQIIMNSPVMPTP